MNLAFSFPLWLKYLVHHTKVVAVTTRVQSSHCCRRLQKYCSAMRKLINTAENSFKMSLSIWLHNTTPSPCLRKQQLRSESQRVFIEGMPLALPFNVDILSRNGRVSEVCHLPDDITIKANGSLTTYKLFGVTYGNGKLFRIMQECACLRPPGTTDLVVRV